MIALFLLLFVLFAIISDITYHRAITKEKYDIAMRSYAELYNEHQTFFSGIISKVITPEIVFERCKLNGIEKYLKLDKDGKKYINNVIVNNIDLS